MKFKHIIPMTVVGGLLAGCAQSMAQPATPQAGMATTKPMAAATVSVGGQPMFASKDIIDNAVNSADHTTLVAAVKAAGLVDTLKMPGPYTVFAPTNAAFDMLPAGTVTTLLKPDHKPMLTKVLTYHVVAGRYDFDGLHRLVMEKGGRAELKTVAGETLIVMMNGPHNVVLHDAKGGTAHITTYDVTQSNGVIQVIDRVLLPG